MLDYNALKQQFHLRPQRTAVLVMSLALIMLVITFFGYRAMFPAGLQNNYEGETVRSERIFRPSEDGEHRLDTLQSSISSENSVQSPDNLMHSVESQQGSSARSGDHVPTSSSTGGLLFVMIFMVLMLVLLYAAIGYLRRRGVPGIGKSMNDLESLNEAPVQLLYTETTGSQEQVKIVRVVNHVFVSMHVAGTTPLLLHKMTMEEWVNTSGVKQ